MKPIEKELLQKHGITVGEYLGGGASAKVYAIKPYKGQDDMCIKYIFNCTRDSVEQEYAHYKELYNTMPDRFAKVLDLVYIDVPDEANPHKTHKAAALVMEKLIKADTRNLSVRTALKILYDVATCISIMHISKMFHRDVKLDNILYSPRTNTYILVDYNISRYGKETFTEQYFVGTFNNVAPESLKGDYSPRSDFYALGMALREYYSGPEIDLAFDPSMSRQQIIERIYNAKARLRPLTENDTGCPQLAEIINKLTAFNREDRYRNYRELMVTLNRLIKELDVDISTEDAPYSVYFVAVNRSSPRFDVEAVRKLTNSYIRRYRITNSVVCVYSFAQDLSVRTLKNGDARLVCEDAEGDFIENLKSRTEKIYKDYRLSDKSKIHICVAGAKESLRDKLSRSISGYTKPASRVYSIALKDGSMDVSTLNLDCISLAKDPKSLEAVLDSWFTKENQ